MELRKGREKGLVEMLVSQCSEDAATPKSELLQPFSQEGEMPAAQGERGSISISQPLRPGQTANVKSQEALRQGRSLS